MFWPDAVGVAMIESGEGDASDDEAVEPYGRERRRNPDSFAISLKEKGGTDRQLLHPPTRRRQSMRGFDPAYVDIVDYIVRITHRIWEQKDIGYIYDTYRHNSR
jgi:hypothetical protein